LIFTAPLKFLFFVISSPDKQFQFLAWEHPTTFDVFFSRSGHLWAPGALIASWEQPLEPRPTLELQLGELARTLPLDTSTPNQPQMADDAASVTADQVQAKVAEISQMLSGFVFSLSVFYPTSHAAPVWFCRLGECEWCLTFFFSVCRGSTVRVLQNLFADPPASLKENGPKVFLFVVFV
jgi:hypothetical protein